MMKMLFEKLLSVCINFMELTKIHAIIEEFRVCVSKMECSTKFIEFFVNDILDFTLLTKN